MYFRCGTEAFLPMVCPVMILHGHLLGSLGVSAHRHTVDQTTHECQEAENEEYYAQYPHEQGLKKLYDDDEAQRDQYESKVEQQHQAAHALSVRTKRIRRRHGLNGDSRFTSDLGLDRRHFRGGETVAPVRVVARSRPPAPVAPVGIMRSSTHFGRRPVRGAGHVNVRIMVASRRPGSGAAGRPLQTPGPF